MADPVWARRLTDEEGRRLPQIVRRGKHGSIRVRRALIIMASGATVPAIARLGRRRTLGVPLRATGSGRLVGGHERPTSSCGVSRRGRGLSWENLLVLHPQLVDS